MSNTITPNKGLGKIKKGEVYRLQKFMDVNQLQPIDIYNKTGISVRTITHSLYEEKPLGSKLLRELHQKYGVSIDWLVSGVGTMFINQHDVSESPESYAAENPRSKRICQFVADFMTYASADEQAWLETELKFNLRQYKSFLEENNDPSPPPNC